MLHNRADSTASIEAVVLLSDEHSELKRTLEKRLADTVSQIEQTESSTVAQALTAWSRDFFQQGSVGQRRAAVHTPQSRF